MTAVRVVFLGRLAKEDVTARLKEVPGIDVFVTEDFAEMLKVLRGDYERGGGNYEIVEIAGLYWHFVDLVWVFIFAFFYLW